MGIWSSLTDEQKDKARACKSMDELRLLAGEEGIELADELLDSIAGGYITPLGNKNPGYAVVDDNTGATIDIVYNSDRGIARDRAKNIARENNQSDRALTLGDINRLREKAGIAPLKGSFYCS